MLLHGHLSIELHTLRPAARNKYGDILHPKPAPYVFLSGWHGPHGWLVGVVAAHLRSRSTNKITARDVRSFVGDRSFVVCRRRRLLDSRSRMSSEGEGALKAVTIHQRIGMGWWRCGAVGEH